MRHFDESLWWDILAETFFMWHFDEYILSYILMRHFDEIFEETFWWHIWWDVLMNILMRHFHEVFWWDILMGHFDDTFWSYIRLRHFNDTFWWDIWMAGNGCIFVLNITRLVIKLPNCMTGLSNFNQRVQHWLPWPFSLFVQCPAHHYSLLKLCNTTIPIPN